MQLDETTPSSLQRQIVERRQKFYSNIAAKKVIDLPIDLRRHRKITPRTESVSLAPIDYWPASFCDIESDWNMDFPRLAINMQHKNYSPEFVEPIDAIFKIREIQRAVCKAYNANFNDILSARRVASIVEPRHVAIMLVNHLTKLSMPEIGRRFGGRDHTTILYAIRKLDLILPEVIKSVKPGATPLQWAFVAKSVFERSPLKKKSG